MVLKVRPLNTTIDKERELPTITHPLCVKPHISVTNSQAHWPVLLAGIVFFKKLFGTFSCCPHTHVLLKLEFCSGFPFFRQCCSTVQSPKSAPVILHSHLVGLGPDSRACQYGSQDWALFCTRPGTVQGAGLDGLPRRSP